MKTLLHARAKAGLSIVLTIGSLICFCSAIAIGNSRQTGHQDASVAANASTAPRPSDYRSEADNEEDRERFQQLPGIGQGGVLPAEFAKARATALALPLSPLLNGRKFQPAQAGTAPQPSFTPGCDPSSHHAPTPWNTDDNSVRIVAFGLHPTNTAVVYAGGYGGLQKSTDAGQTWRTSFDGGQSWRTYLSDDWESQAVSSITIDPNQPTNIYVGTGTYDNPGTYGGAGVYRSTDDGEHWQLFSGYCPSCGQNGVGDVFTNTMIRDVVIDPRNSGIAANTTLYVATDRFDTLGGLWKSTDGGETWSLVLVGTLL